MKEKIKPARLVELSETGGILLLIPIFGGLIALGTLIGGDVAVARSVNSAKSTKQQLEKSQRNIKFTEAIALGREQRVFFVLSKQLIDLLPKRLLTKVHLMMYAKLCIILYFKRGLCAR